MIENGTPSLFIHAIYDKDDVPRSDELPKPRASKDLAQDQIMVRKRLYGVQQFEPEHGLVSKSPHLYFHKDFKAHEVDDTCPANDPFDYPLERSDRVYEERSVLIQSLEHYQKVKENPAFSTLMPNGLSDVLDDVRFGENMIVSGLDNTQVCVGDIFEVQGGDSKLRLQVTSPRKPCSLVDRKNGAPYGSNGLRRYTLSHGLAGWFVRVLESGNVREGMKLIRVENPHPKWTLEYVSKTLYAEGDRQHFLMCWAKWARAKEELEELCSLPAFGWYEWKAEAQWLLDRWGQEDILAKSDNTDVNDQLVSSPSSFAASSIAPFKLLPSLHLGSLLPSHLHSQFSHWMAVAIFGLAWIAVGLTVVVQDEAIEEG